MPQRVAPIARFLIAVDAASAKRGAGGVAGRPGPGHGRRDGQHPYGCVYRQGLAG